MGMVSHKRNCWEFMNCGRNIAGSINESVCPAVGAESLDGAHGGLNGGRACWVVAGTFCGGRVQGMYAEKYRDCMGCDFYKAVRREEHAGFLLTGDLLDMLRRAS